MNEFDNNQNSNEITPDINNPSDSDADIPTPFARKVLKEIVSWILCIAIALAAAMVIRTWLFTVVRVEGNSMNPTLQTNERMFARIIAYTPERGDMIILHPKGREEAYIKRIIATEGDRIWIDEVTGDVHLKKNGSDEWEILEEDYIAEKSRFAGIAQKFADESGEGLLIEEDHVFVMGDNRNHSADSRDGERVGQVHEDDIIGKASFRWWPLSEFGFVE